MSFTIQHPVSGLSWAADEDGKLVLSSTVASVYSIDDDGHIHNTNTDACVYGIPGLGEAFEERGHYGCMPAFEWTIADDGSVSGPPAFGAWWIGEDLQVAATPFAWKKVAATRSASLLATASVPEPEPEPEPEA